MVREVSPPCGLVAQVVDVAVDGALGAAGPFAGAAGAELDGAADVAGDAGGAADVQDHGLAVVGGVEEAAAQGGRRAGPGRRPGRWRGGRWRTAVPARLRGTVPGSGRWRCLGRAAGAGPLSPVPGRGVRCRGAAGVAVRVAAGSCRGAGGGAVPGGVEVGQHDGDHLVDDGDVGGAGDDGVDDRVARGDFGVRAGQVAGLARQGRQPGVLQFGGAGQARAGAAREMTASTWVSAPARPGTRSARSRSWQASWRASW